MIGGHNMKAQEFEHIYMSTRAKLSAIARRYSMAVDFDLDEQDVVQEALTALWELSEKGYPIRNAEALLVRITKNICAGQYRRQKNRTQVPLEDTIPQEGPVSGRIESEDEDMIKQLLYETLTKTEREYMIMKTDEEMSLDEISEKTGKDKPGIKTALSKARKKLKDAFKNNGYE